MKKTIILALLLLSIIFYVFGCHYSVRCDANSCLGICLRKDKHPKTEEGPKESQRLCADCLRSGSVDVCPHLEGEAPARQPRETTCAETSRTSRTTTTRTTTTTTTSTTTSSTTTPCTTVKVTKPPPATSKKTTPTTTLPTTVAPTTTAPPVTTTKAAVEGSFYNNYEEEVVRLVNLERAKENLPALCLDASLRSSARIRAKEIIGCWGHDRPNGSKFHTVIQLAYSLASENIAAGPATPDRVVSCWMNSTGHRANIMNPDVRRIGVGCYYDSTTDYKIYWVQLFTGP